MADFTSSIWSWIIGLSTIVSIVGLIYFVKKLTIRRPDNSDEPVETMGHVWDENLEEFNNPLPAWWLNLFYITLLWGLLYLALYPGLGAFKGFLGWSQESRYEQEVAAAKAEYEPLFEQFMQTPIPELAGNPQAVSMGERLFSTYCATCHGSDARGARGFPNLRDGDWLYGGEPDNIITSITDGRSGVMPPWQDILKPEQITQVAQYTQQVAGRTVDTAAAEAGKAVYDVNCVACHGADGKGNILLGAPDLTDDIWVYGGSENKILESIALGRNGVMPPHGEFLGAAKVHLLATYIYQFRTQ